MTSVGALEFTLQANEAPVLQALGAVQKKAQETGQAVTASLDKTLKGVVKDIAFEASAATVAFGGLATAALMASKSYQDAVAKVRTLSSDTAGLESAVRGLSAELDNQASRADLLTASYDVLSSGFADTADVTKILDASVKGAVGGFSTVGTVADATTTILNAYNLSASQAARVVDQMAQTQDKGKIVIDQYAQGIGRLAGIAATAGVSMEEMNAAIASASAKGVPAESAISGTRQAIVNLIKPTADAEAVMRQFGIINEQAGISSGAAAVRTLGLVGILEKLRDQGATSDQLAQIFSDVDGLAVAANLAGENLEGFKANIDAMANAAGKADKSMQAASQSIGAEFTKALNATTNALAEFGNVLAKPLVPLLKGVAAVSTALANLPAPIKAGIVVLGGMAFALTAATAALAAFELADGKAKVSLIASTLAKSKDIAITTAWAAVTGKGTGAALQYATAIRGMIAALAKAAVVAGALYTLNEAIQSSGRYSQALADSNKELEKSIVELSEASQKGSGIFQEYGDYYTAQEAANRRVADSLGWVARAVDEVTKAYRFLFRDSTDAIIGQIQTWINKILELLKLPPQITNAFTSAFQKIGKPLLDTFLPVASIAKQLNLLEKPATNYERAIQQTQIETAKLTGTIDAALNTFQKFQTGTKLSAEEQEKLQKGLQASKAELEAQIQKYPELEGVLKPYLAQVNNAIGALEKQTESEKKNTQAKKEQATAIEQLTAAYKEQAGLRQQDFDQAKVTTSGAVARNEIGADEARQKDLAAEKTYLEEMVRLNTEAAAKLRANAKLAADDKKQEYLDEALKLEQEAQSMRIQIQENGNQQIVAKNEATLNKLRAANEKANAAIVASAQAREAALLQASNEREAQIFDALKRGVINQQEYDRQIAAARRESEQASVNAAIQTSQARIAAIQKEIEQVASLRQQGVISAQEAAAQELQLTQNLSQEKTNLVQAEINAQQLNRDAQLTAIQEQRDRFVEAMDVKIAANERATAAIEANAQREQAVRDRVLASLEAERALIEARAGLSTALAAAEQQATQFKIDGYTRAIEIQQQLASGEITSKEQQKALENELRLLGVSRQTEVLDLVKKRQAQEDLLAQQQRDAMLAQQEQQRVLLENEIRRNELLDQQAIATAKVNELLGQQAVLQAQLNLAKADPTNATEVANLQQQLELSRQIAEQARGTVEAAIDNAAATAKVNQIKRETLKIEQETERKAFDKAQQTRNEVQNQELIRAKLEDQAKARGKNTQRTLENQQAQQGVTAAVNTTTTAVGRMGDAIDNATDSAAGLRSEIEGAAKAASAIPAAIEAGKRSTSTVTVSSRPLYTEQQQRAFDLLLPEAQRAVEEAKKLLITGMADDLPASIKGALNALADTQLIKREQKGSLNIGVVDEGAAKAAIKRFQELQEQIKNAEETAKKADALREQGDTKAAEQIGRYLEYGMTKELDQFIKSLERTYQAPSAIPAGETGTVQIDSSQVAAISNDGVEARLDTLIDVNRQALASPRSLTVSSPEPVKDAAAIFGEMSRNATIREGL